MAANPSEKPIMSDFTSLTDQQVVRYLVDHYHDIGTGEPDADLAERLIRAIELGTVALERRDGAFAIIALANRKHSGHLSFIHIRPEADLMFLLVAADARSNGSGSALLNQVKEKYMEDQSMVLVCAGEKRKRFFEKAGFVAQALTEQGLHYMVCPPLQQITNS